METMNKSIVIHTDGGSRGNPGPAAIGVVIDTPDGKRHEFGRAIGDTTNNVAEYTAVHEALVYLIDRGLRREGESITFILDSLLVVQQLNGVYKIKNATLQNLAFKVKELEHAIGGGIVYTAVRREHNTDADLLVNRALDARG